MIKVIKEAHNLQILKLDDLVVITQVIHLWEELEETSY